MKTILDHDPLSGITTYFEYVPSEDRMLITDVQDVNPTLEFAKALARDEDYSRQGIKNDMWHYARIPVAVMYEMKEKHGVDMMAPKPDWKSIFRTINTHYPMLKATTKTHA